MANAQVDTTSFNTMCRDLSNLTAVKHQKVIKSEIRSVLTATVKYTPAIKVGKTRARHAAALFTSQPATLYLPKHRYKLGSRSFSKNGFTVYYLKNRYPDQLWNAIVSARKRKLTAILGARGLAQKSWDQIAEILGLTLAIPNYVRAAVPTSGRQYKNVSATTNSNPAQFQINIANAQPTVNLPRVGGARALERAISGRVKFFERNCKNAIFGDMKTVAKAYPGLQLSLTP